MEILEIISFKQFSKNDLKRPIKGILQLRIILKIHISPTYAQKFTDEYCFSQDFVTTKIENVFSHSWNV